MPGMAGGGLQHSAGLGCSLWHRRCLLNAFLPHAPLPLMLPAVRCYGTEGRRKDNEVPPSEQVFEYVVFKGK